MGATIPVWSSGARVVVPVVLTAMLVAGPARAWTHAWTHGFFFQVGTGVGVVPARVGYSGPVENDALSGSRQGSLHDGALGIGWNFQLAAGSGFAPHWTAGLFGEGDYVPGFVVKPELRGLAAQQLLMVSPALFARWDAKADARSGWWVALHAGAVRAGLVGSVSDVLQPGNALDESALSTLWGPAAGLAVGYAIRDRPHFEWGPRLGLRVGYAASRHGSLTYGALTVGIVLGRR